MIVTIHQPNLFPWLGYFDKMAAADLFVLLDDVPFTKGGYQNRVKLKGAGGEQWLTVPVSTKGKLGQPTNEVEINSLLPWQRDHLRLLEANYHKTTFFPSLFPRLQRLYESADCRLLTEFAMPGIELIRDALGIRTPLVRSSEWKFAESGSRLLCELVKKAGGTVYLSGPSGRDYLDETLFAAEGIRVAYHRFETMAYPQPFGDFAGGLSALDFIFNAGGETAWKQGNIA